jgi:Glycine cleavage H-protein
MSTYVSESVKAASEIYSPLTGKVLEKVSAFKHNGLGSRNLKDLSDRYEIPVARYLYS